MRTLVAAFATVALASPSFAQQGRWSYVSGEIIVCPEMGSGQRVRDLLTAASCEVREVDAVSGALRVRVPVGQEVAQVTRWTKTRGVVYAERNGLGRVAQIPNDTHYAQQWHLRNTGQSGGLVGADIRAEDAWDLSTGSANVVIAVLDSGMDMDHPDFVGRIDADGYDFVNNDSDPEDDLNHGTHVAGVLCANSNNGFGVAGVDWQCKLLPIKVINASSTGTVYDLAQGLNYCATQSDVAIISMSLQNYPGQATLLTALQAARNADKILIACAGNNGIGSANFSYPGAADTTISIGATTNLDRRASFSGTGSTVDFVGPGSQITTSAFDTASDSFAWVSGCSFATPIVAGVVGLALARAGQLGMAPPSHDDIYGLLRAGARDQVGPASQDPPGRDDFFGHGRIDARLVLEAVPSVSDCGDGNVGLATGGPFDVLRLNGEARDGASRLIPVPINVGATVTMDVPPSLPQPGPVPALFLIAGHAGAPGTALPTALPFGWGTMCFDPGGAGGFLLLGGTAPWSGTTPPVPAGFRTSLQGLILHTAQADIALTNMVAFAPQVFAAPVIGNVQPEVAAVGTTVRVLGSGFQLGAVLTIDGVSVPSMRVAATELQFVTPANVACDATLTVSNLDGQSANATFHPSPTLATILTPGGVPAAGGTQLFLIGTGFAPGMSVTVAGNAATITATSASSIFAVLPPGSVGPAALVITTASGCSVSGTVTYTP